MLAQWWAYIYWRGPKKYFFWGGGEGRGPQKCAIWNCNYNLQININMWLSKT